MSMRLLSSLNSPPLVAGVGAAIVVGFPLVNMGALSVGALKLCNILAFCTNVVAVSIPGRMDGDRDAQMRSSGDLNPNDNRNAASSTTTPLTGGSSSSSSSNNNNNNNNIVRASRDKTLVAPAGWAFSIWGPIYLGEALFCASQFYDPTILAALPQLTAPFVAANLTQSLWCASFRPSYTKRNNWHKYVSVAMLGGTAFSLSHIPFADIAASSSSWYLVPLAMHFGWTTAATLVNLNGSLAMTTPDNSDTTTSTTGTTTTSGASESTIIAAGHASSVLAAALGVGVTMAYGLPAYGFTIAWALTACVNGMRVTPNDPSASNALKAGAKVQKLLLGAGAALSAGSAIFVLVQ